MMKKFNDPMVTISKEHYKQLQECKSLIELLWEKFGPYDWPEEFRLPRGKSFSDFLPENSTDFKFYQFKTRMNNLMIMSSIDNAIQKIIDRCKVDPSGISVEAFTEEELEDFRDTMNDLIIGKRKRQSLYRSLHNVGDDPIKSEIQADLQTALDDDTYALVEAIFHWNTDGE